MNRGQIIKRLTEYLPNLSTPDLRSLVKSAIALQQSRVDELVAIFDELTQPQGELGHGILEYVPPSAKPTNLTTAEMIAEVLKDAKRPLGVSEIREELKRLFKRDLKTNNIGGVLWKNKGKRFRKLGKSTRYATWKLIREE